MMEKHIQKPPKCQYSLRGFKIFINFGIGILILSIHLKGAILDIGNALQTWLIFTESIIKTKSYEH